MVFHWKKMAKVLAVLAAGGVLAGCSLTLPVGKNQGALQVMANLGVEVFLNETHVGQTPFFDEKLKTGEYTLKLVPNGAENQAWQSKVVISKGVLTVVNYEFGANSESGGYAILELTEIVNKKASEIAITSVPDNVVVRLDGELTGFSPMSFEEVTPGDHTIGLEAAGYKQRVINAKTSEGHRLRVTVKLARDSSLAEVPAASESASEQIATDEETAPEASPTPSLKASPSPTPKSSDGVISGATSASGLSKPYVQILDTGLGWLRVRSKPTGVGDNEVAKVKVGTFFPFVEQDETGWTKLEYEEGKEGFVASKYVKVTE